MQVLQLKIITQVCNFHHRYNTNNTQYGTKQFRKSHCRIFIMVKKYISLKSNSILCKMNFTVNGRFAHSLTGIFMVSSSMQMFSGAVRIWGQHALSTPSKGLKSGDCHKDPATEHFILNAVTDERRFLIKFYNAWPHSFILLKQISSSVPFEEKTLQCRMFQPSNSEYQKKSNSPTLINSFVHFKRSQVLQAVLLYVTLCHSLNFVHCNY